MIEFYFALSALVLFLATWIWGWPSSLKTWFHNDVMCKLGRKRDDDPATWSWWARAYDWLDEHPLWRWYYLESSKWVQGPLIAGSITCAVLCGVVVMLRGFGFL